MTVSLEVNLAGIKLRNPVLNGVSDPTSATAEILLKAAENGVGGLVTKTISSKPAVVKKPSIYALKMKIDGKVSYGLLNCELWDEKPYEYWVNGGIQKAKTSGLPVITSLGYKPEDMKLLAPLVEKAGADAIEFSTHYVEYDPKPIIEIAKTLRENTKLPIFMKMSPHTKEPRKFAKALEPYVDGFVAINTLGPALKIDIERGKPVLGAVYGWLSGAAIKPLGVRFVAEIAKVTKKPVIGVGGISTGEDVIEYVMAGATAVEVCTAAILNGPKVYGKIVNEIKEWLEKHNYASLDEIRGIALEYLPE
ncbi:MAG: dihydroorotate dehydrogenase [Candidatus Asgardarchaeia archaeon]